MYLQIPRHPLDGGGVEQVGVVLKVAVERRAHRRRVRIQRARRRRRGGGGGGGRRLACYSWAGRPSLCHSESDVELWTVLLVLLVLQGKQGKQGEQGEQREMEEGASI